MGRFDRALRTLRDTKIPLFARMAASGEAIPMCLGVRRLVVERIELGKRGKVGGALWLLGQSRRYLQACAAPGAMRHDLEGNIVGPVSKAHQAHARAELERMAALHTHPGLVALPGAPATLEQH